jgi:hypothetical protein
MFFVLRHVNLVITCVTLGWRKPKYRVLSAVGYAALVATASATAFGDRPVYSISKDIASIMSERSPGARTSGKTSKHKRAQASHERDTASTNNGAAPPEARAANPSALSEAKPEAPGSAAPVVIDSPEVAAAFGAEPRVGVPRAPFAASVPGLGGAGGVSGGAVTVPGGGGAGGGTSPGAGATAPDSVTAPPGGVIPPTTSVAAVPEPSTWMTMIFGFGAVGFSLRRNRRRLSRSTSLGSVANG